MINSMIDKEAIEKELQEILVVCKLKVKLNRQLDAYTNIRYTDNRITITINPSRIHTKAQLDKTLAYLRDEMESEANFGI